MSERKIKASSKTATKKNKKTIKTKKAVVKKQPVKKTTKKKVAVTTRKKVEKKEALVGDLGFTPIVDRNQIDTQKKFYQELSKEIDQKHLEGDIDENVVENNNSEKIYRQPASIGLYRKRAFFFIALTAILILAIFYFSFTKLTILVTPTQEIVNNNVLLDIYSSDNNPHSAQVLTGSVMAITVNEQKTYTATGEEIIGQEVTGTVELINNYTKNQPLVATTRLLSSDDKLFRIKDTTNIPAGGSLEVEIYADQIKPEMAIGPTKFIIPGLWAGLQDKVYAESKKAFVYQTKIERYIKQSDLERARQDLKQRLINKAKAEAQRLFSDDYEIIYDINDDLTTINSDAEIGEKIEEFNLVGESQVVIIAFPKQLAEDLSERKLSLLVPEDKELKEFNAKQLNYSLDNYNLKDGVATVKISFSGKMALREGAEVLDRSQLVNLNREQIEQYLESFPEIQNYSLSFSPRFLNTAPSLADRIIIKIQE